MAGKLNSGYLMPDKGRGKININGREDKPLVCQWLNPEHSELSVQVKDEAQSNGMLKPHTKTSPNQPDFRGKFVDEQGKEWWISAWNRPRDDGEIMWSVSITDPATLRQNNSQQGASAPAPAAAPAPARDPNAMPPLDSPSDYSLDDITDIFQN